MAAGTAPTDAVNKSQLDTVDATAKAAQGVADAARETADQAQGTATGAVAAAAQAQGAADTAQRTADTALTAADGARQAADNAQTSADRVADVADRSADQLQGLGADETVVGRLQEATRAGNQALADALGGGAAVNADGTLSAAVFNVTGVAQDGGTSSVAAASVGEAIEALDGSLATVKNKADKASADVGTLRGQLDRGEVGLVRQDPGTRDIQVAKDTDGTRVDFAGSQGPRTLGGVQDGEISATSTDAVTGRQLDAVNQQVRQLGQQASGIAVDSRGDGSDKARVTPGSQAVAVGADAHASGQASVATGAGATAQGDRSTAVGAGASASADNSVALGAGSTADRPNTVSVGAAGNERQISHVAEATQATDAVNLDQATRLSNQAADRTLRQANAYTDRQVSALRQDAFSGIASAMAMAALPAASTPGRSMVAMGTAVYEGQSALAVGLSGRSEDGNWAYKANGSGSAQGSVGLAVGVGYEW
ncbi:YadA family autotransporter adhesin [Pseudomonas sp.]|uniref:YadA family autotransporter adhesin n=1 Tax=Pseudomonas sp. TaxID=306 RepID=UPI003D144C58